MQKIEFRKKAVYSAGDIISEIDSEIFAFQAVKEIDYAEERS